MFSQMSPRHQRLGREPCVGVGDSGCSHSCGELSSVRTSAAPCMGPVTGTRVVLLWRRNPGSCEQRSGLHVPWVTLEGGSRGPFKRLCCAAARAKYCRSDG